MTTVELPVHPRQARSLPPWLDLIFYLVFGLGGAMAASLAVGFVFNPTMMAAALILITLHVTFIGGSVLLLSAWRNQLDLSAIGFIPPRVTGKLVNLAVAAWLASLPVQFVAGFIADLIIGGGRHSSRTLMELLAPDGFSWFGLLVSLVGAGILAPIAEELFFRGAIFGWFRARYNFRVATLVSAGLFGILHYGSAPHIASSFVFGLATAYMFERTGTLWVPIAMHITSNSVAVCLLYAHLA